MSEVLIILLLLLTVIVRLVFEARETARLLPSGPQGRLMSGNAHQIPKARNWVTYAKWGEEYGPIVSFRTYLRRHVVLNTAKAVTDLLEKRSSTYSDRPISWMLFNLCGRGLSVFNISSQNERHKKYRKLLYTGLNSTAIQRYWENMQEETRLLLSGLRETPDLYELHIRKHAASIIMMVAYGYIVKDLNDTFISHAKETSQITGLAMAPGRWLVDSFPIMRFLPAWFPGAQFKRQALKWRGRFDYLSSVPHMWVKEQISAGVARRSFTSEFMCPEDGSYPSQDEEDIIKWCASGLYAGAADTTVSAMISFMMLMALFPEVQTRAQKEIDEKIGYDGLPSFDRFEDLPFISAVLKEVLRFAPVGPLALPHMVTKNDQYEGFNIPRGTTIIANVWAIMHDANIYPDPFSFDPGRFYTSSSQENVQYDPRKFAFGFGARICPGMQFAEKSLLMCMCGILSTFNIRKAEQVSRINFTTGNTRYDSSIVCIL